MQLCVCSNHAIIIKGWRVMAIYIYKCHILKLRVCCQCYSTVTSVHSSDHRRADWDVIASVRQALELRVGLPLMGAKIKEKRI